MASLRKNENSEEKKATNLRDKLTQQKDAALEKRWVCMCLSLSDEQCIQDYSSNVFLAIIYSIRHTEILYLLFLLREAHLRELRDKLQAQNKKAKQVKLKKIINGPPVPVPLGSTAQVFLSKGIYDGLFDWKTSIWHPGNENGK